MPVSTTFMTLETWPAITDQFDHVKLADNFQRLDAHDHTPGKGTPVPTGGIVDGAITEAKLAALVQAALFSPGDLKASAALILAGSEPGGWLVCDGRSVLRTDYPDLFAVLGGTSSPWGVADGTHFNLPDYKDRVLLGANPSALTGRSIRHVGDVGGEESHTLTVGELPPHSHAINDPGHTHQIQGEQNQGAGALSAPYMPVKALDATFWSTASATTGITVLNAGGGAAHNNMMPFAVASVLVKF